MSDINEEILYWCNYFGYEWIDCDQLIEYVKENFIRTKKEVVIEFVELTDVRINDIYMLDWNYICDNDNDYVEIVPGKYLNIFLLEVAGSELEKNGLVRC